MPRNRAVIFANGMVPDIAAVRRMLRDDDFLIAADGGCRHALASGRTPDLLIGDQDSISDADRDLLSKVGTQVLSFPPAKDETDLELALGYALRQEFRTIRIVGALGGRTDHTLANLSLLAAPACFGVDLACDDGREEVFCVYRELSISGKPGDAISLLPLGSSAEGVRTKGLKYSLNGETLLPYKTRGVSNVLLGEDAAVTLERGMLICVHTRSTEP